MWHLHGLKTVKLRGSDVLVCAVDEYLSKSYCSREDVLIYGLGFSQKLNPRYTTISHNA